MGRLSGKIDEVFIHDAADAVDSTVNGGHLGEFTGLEGDAHDTLVDHMGGAATLCHEYFSF